MSNALLTRCRADRSTSTLASEKAIVLGGLLMYRLLMSDIDQPVRYEKQHRGTQEAYEAYFAGMDSSMQQKVALTTAHFPVKGRIADMGSGSGRGTFDLACLYQDFELVGVDINPISVERASHQFQRPNLSYTVGDISDAVFARESLD